MNIGIVTYWFERGAAYVSKEFEKALSTRHKVFIYARGGEGQAKGNPRWDHPNVHWSTHEPRYYRTYIDKKEFSRWVKENAIEVALFNEQTYFEPILWCKELGVKTMAYIDYYTETTVPLFGVYDALICNTKRHCSAFEDLDTVYYLPWGTDVNLYRPAGEDGSLVEDGKVVFFNSAGMSPERKGTDIFIRALDQCAHDARVKGLVHSQKNLRKYMPELTDVIDRLQKAGKLEIVEKTIPAPGLYTKADVYVYPSRLDGIGLTVAEAISSGLACVASDNPPMNEFVQPEYGSLIPIDRLYARNDGYYWPQCRCRVDKLAEIMLGYAQDLDKVKAMKRNARAYALEHLSADKNFPALADIVEQVSMREVSDAIKSAINAFDNDGIKKFTLSFAKSNIYKLIPYKWRMKRF